MRSDFCAAKYLTSSSVSDLLTRGEMRSDFCAAKYLTLSSISDPLRPSPEWFFPITFTRKGARK